MTQVSLSQNKPVGGGSGHTLHLSAGVALKITPLRGSQVDFNEYRELSKLQEYISDEYCLICAYFRVFKGHFGTCPDLPYRKPYDGAKKGSSCALWRLKTVYLKLGLSQQLPEKPTIRYIPLKVVRRRDQQYRKPRQHTYWSKYILVQEPWFWNMKLPKFVYDYLLNPEPLPESIDLREPYGHYSDKLVWKDGKYRSKKPIPKPIMKTCCHCGKLFEQQPQTVGLYCSQTCYHKHRWGNGKNHQPAIPVLEVQTL